MKSFTTFQTTLVVAGQSFDVFAEVDICVSRGGFDYGFGKQRQIETEATVEVSDFEAQQHGQEVTDEQTRRLIAAELDEAVWRAQDRILEKANV